MHPPYLLAPTISPSAGSASEGMTNSVAKIVPESSSMLYPTVPNSAAPTFVPQLASGSVYGGSCENMAEVTSGSVDLIVTSPPYWVSPEDTLLAPALLRNKRGSTPGNYEGLLVLLDRCFAEMWRVLKPGGFLCINVASTLVKGKLYPLPFDLSVRLVVAGWEFKEEIIWRRWRGWDRRAGNLIQNPYPGRFYPNRVFEYVLVFKKPGPPIYEGRSEHDKQDSRIPIDDLLTKEIANSIWTILPEHQSRRKGGHPCPFPEELAYRLITLYSYKNDVVLDPFTGSGTTGKVARLTGRRFFGYEVNPRFAQVACERLKETEIRRERRVCRFDLLESVHEKAPTPVPAESD